jgi:hypothetical protein
MNNRLAKWRYCRDALAASVVAVSGAGCGNAPAPTAASPAAVPSAPAVSIAAPAAPDTSEVAEPATLVGLVRWKSPQATLDTVSQWLGLHLSAAELAAEAIDRGVAETLRFDAPVDAAVALDPDPNARDEIPLFAVAVGVRSIEDARRAAAPSTEISPGRYRVQMVRGKRKGELPFCVLSAAAGPAPARVVCGRRERDVEVLAPYLTRTAPRRDLGPSDLHAELRAAPLFSTYGTVIDRGLRMGAAFVPRQFEVGEPAFDRVLGRIALGVSDELGSVAADLDGLVVDLAVQPERAHLEFAFRFRGHQSWTASLLSSQASKSGAPPPLFFHLPRQATSASFAVSAETRRFDGIRHALGELVDGWLLHEGLDTPDRAAVDELFSDKYTTDAAWANASGSFEPTASAPTQKSKGPAPATRSADEPGWYMLGIDAPNQAVDFVKRFAAALGRPKIQAYIKAKLALVNGKTGPTPSPVTLKPVPSPKELPKGSLDYEVSIGRSAWEAASPPKPARAANDADKSAPILRLHLLVVPVSGGPTFLLLGSDRAQLSALARAAADHPDEGQTLASRAELAALKDEKVVGAGFTTLAALIEPWYGSFLPYAAAGRDKRNVLLATPNKGQTSIIIRSRLTANDAIVLTTDFTVPRGAIEDGIIFVTTSSLLGATTP